MKSIRFDNGGCSGSRPSAATLNILEHCRPLLWTSGSFGLPMIRTDIVYLVAQIAQSIFTFENHIFYRFHHDCYFINPNNVCSVKNKLRPRSRNDKHIGRRERLFHIHSQAVRRAPKRGGPRVSIKREIFYKHYINMKNMNSIFLNRLSPYICFRLSYALFIGTLTGHTCRRNVFP